MKGEPLEQDGPVSLNIGNICGGAVPELFEHEIAKMMENIADVNTDPEAKRSLTLECSAGDAVTFS